MMLCCWLTGAGWGRRAKTRLVSLSWTKSERNWTFWLNLMGCGENKRKNPFFLDGNIIKFNGSRLFFSPNKIGRKEKEGTQSTNWTDSLPFPPWMISHPRLLPIILISTSHTQLPPNYSYSAQIIPLNYGTFRFKSIFPKSNISKQNTRKSRKNRHRKEWDSKTIELNWRNSNRRQV